MGGKQDIIGGLVILAIMSGLAMFATTCAEEGEWEGTRHDTDSGEHAGTDKDTDTDADTAEDTDTSTLPDDQIAVQVSAGFWHTCALDAADGVKCWGANYKGELGNGATAYFDLYPDYVIGLETGIAAVSAGWESTCALTLEGGVLCWGWNYAGQVGNGEGGEIEDAVLTPAGVIGLGSGMQSIATGDGRSCAWSPTGDAFCWGSNECGFLGDGAGGDCDNDTDPHVFSPVPAAVISPGAPAAVIDPSGRPTCSVTMDGAVACWGWNNYGVLGAEEPAFSDVPVIVPGLESGFTAVTVGGYHACALTEAGAAVCWGQGTYGQLGNGEDGVCVDHDYLNDVSQTTPLQVDGLESGVVMIDAGFSHTCALTAAGGVLCWGSDEKGQVGDGGSNSEDCAHSTVPVDVVGLESGVVSITSGHEHSCALLETGGIKCWGMGGFGQLGQQSTTYTQAPVDVIGYGGI